MSSWNIAIVGASGQVGSALIELLQQVRNHGALPIERIGLIGSDNSEGDSVRVFGKNVTIEHIEKTNWHQYHLAFFAVPSRVSTQYAKLAAQSGCVVVDISGAFAQEDNIPLILPKINDSVLVDYRNENIISVASPIVSQSLRTVASLTDVGQLAQMHITNFIPASFCGKHGVNELASQSARLLNGLPIENNCFDKQQAFNILPVSKTFADEAMIIEQIRKITSTYSLAISIDTMLVPVFYGLTQSITFTSSSPFNITHYFGQETDQAAFLRYGVKLMVADYPTPVTGVNLAQDENMPSIELADIHYNYGNQEQIKFICVSDNIRYLGARMLLETAEILLTDYM